MNPATLPGAIPEKVSVAERAIVTAGFAKDVEEVKKYAAPIQAGTRAGPQPALTGAGEPTDERKQAGGRDDLAEPQAGGRADFHGGLPGRQVEHEVADRRPGQPSDDLGDDIAARLGRAEFAAHEGDERYGGVEMSP
jgi:hypothetical protein